MNNYISKSVKKFKEDALSKSIYDFLKAMVICAFVFACSKIFPNGFVISEWLNSKNTFTTYSIILGALLLIIITTTFVAILIRRRIKLLREENYTDELTGLKNHKALEQFLPNKITEIIKRNGIMSVIIIDVDNFKEVNTQFQYSVADQILKKLGELLGNEKRGTDETFRKFHRGDEFIVVLENTSLSDATLAAERRRKMVAENEIEVSGQRYKVTMSCGVTECAKEDNMQSLIDRASRALFEAKKQTGKNCTKTIT